MKCLICKTDKIEVKYNGKIRSGSYGKQTADDANVYYCKKCDFSFIDSSMLSSFYETEEYRSSYNDTTDVSEQQKNSDKAAAEYFERLKVDNFRGKDVLDVGSGCGSFIDLVSGLASSTSVIEPAQFFHSHLSKTSKVYSYLDDYITEKNSAEVVTCFDVIEHVPDPAAFASQLFDATKTGGTLILSTPNMNDILVEVAEEHFKSFYYRTAHISYFTKDSICNLLDKVGYSDITVEFVHKLDISNLLYWLKEKRPTGIGYMDMFDLDFDAYYRRYIEKIGRSTHMLLKAEKTPD